MPRPDAPPTDRGSRLGWKAIVLILLYGGTLLGSCLGGETRALTYHEVIFAQPAREMLHTGDWLMTRFGGEPCTHKPPVTAWLIAASMLTAGSRAEWVVRIPAVAAALLTALIIAALASRWYGRRVGVAAGLVQCSAYYVMMQARLAEADMILCLWVTGAFAAFALARLRAVPPPRWLAWVFYACVGLAFMTKFLIGPAFIFGGCLAYVLVQRDWKAWRFFVSPVGWGILAVLVFTWPILAWRQYPQIWQDWWFHNIQRFTGEGKGRNQPWLFYFYMTPALLLPWVIWLIPAVWVGLRERMFRSGRWRLIWLWLAAGMLIITASAWKGKHYVIPALPPLSIVIGWFLVRDSFEKPGRRLGLVPSTVLLVLGCIGAAVGVWVARPEIGWEVAVIIGAAGLALAATVWADALRRPRATLTFLFLAFWAVGVGVNCLIVRHFDVKYRHQAQFGRRLSAAVPEGKAILIFGIPENQVAYYLRFPLERADELPALRKKVRAEGGGTFYVTGPDDAADELRQLGSLVEIDRGESAQQEGARRYYVTGWRLHVAAPATAPLDADTP